MSTAAVVLAAAWKRLEKKQLLDLWCFGWGEIDRSYYFASIAILGARLARN
jgi:hypothetical protein